MGLGCFWVAFGWFGNGLGMVWCMGLGCFWLVFLLFWGSRSPVAEKVEEPEPMRATARSTGRAVWVGLGVFWVGLLDCFCGAGLGWF